MADLKALSAGVREFIDQMGLYFEGFDISRSAGRIMGLLMVTDHPLSLDEIASALQVSRASVSTNARLLASAGLAQPASMPGDRRDFYRYSPHTWERRILAGIASSRMAQRIAEHGLAAIEPNSAVARANLDEMRDFCEFYIREGEYMLERWRAHKHEKHEKRRATQTETPITPSTPSTAPSTAPSTGD
ncbi:MAG: MarR family transcriptional regulator [Ktedonobacterales bacterium]